MSAQIIMPASELKVLRLLQKNKSGMYGSELVRLSGGLVPKGSAYNLLLRLYSKGWVQFDVSCRRLSTR